MKQGDVFANAALQGTEIVLVNDQSQSIPRRTALRLLVDGDAITTLGLSMIAGRNFAMSDIDTSQQVAIVTKALAETCWPGRNPVGQTIQLGSAESDAPWIQIVGVTTDLRNPLLSSAQPVVFLPQSQSANPSGDLIIRTLGDASQTLHFVKQEIRAIDRDVPDLGGATLAEQLSSLTAQPRFSMTALGISAILALLLAIVGIYSVTHYWAAGRVREFGIRAALGAKSSELISLMLRSGLKASCLGVGVGLLGAYGLSRLLVSQLIGVRATDPTVFLAVPVVLVLVSVAASLSPAYRISTVSPLVSLRDE